MNNFTVMRPTYVPLSLVIAQILISGLLNQSVFIFFTALKEVRFRLILT